MIPQTGFNTVRFSEEKQRGNIHESILLKIFQINSIKHCLQ